MLPGPESRKSRSLFTPLRKKFGGVEVADFVTSLVCLVCGEGPDILYLRL